MTDDQPVNTPVEVNQNAADSNNELHAEITTMTQVMQENMLRVQSELQSLGENMEQMQAEFEAKIKYDRSQTQIIDTLHSELQGYRGDLFLKILRPLVNDLITLYDDLHRIAHPAAEWRAQLVTHPEAAQLLANVDTLEFDIEEMLQRNGFEVYENPGEEFNGSMQRIGQTVRTDQPELDTRIAARGRKGFRYGEHVIRPEIVSVYSYKSA